MSDSGALVDKETLLTMPGAEMVLKGLEDSAEERITVEHYLTKIASPVLYKAGLVSHIANSIDDEIKLYELLNKEVEANAYGKYKSLMRLLVSFEKCLSNHLKNLKTKI
jgi:hypothetical protein